jgi:hypothetical protein
MQLDRQSAAAGGTGEAVAWERLGQKGWPREGLFLLGAGMLWSGAGDEKSGPVMGPDFVE